MDHIVVVGGGQAGQSVVETLRTKGYAGRLTLICGEPHLPYQRPPLSKAYLLGEMTRERLLLRPQDWYDERAVDLRLGTRAEALDPVARTVRVGDEVLGYDGLVLTPGLGARSLPAEIGGNLENVFTIRTLADVDALEAPLTSARHVVVVGGGYIGLEAAAVARKLGAEVTVLEAGERILGRVACAETADAMRSLHQSHGVTLREGVTLERLTGDTRVTGAVLSDGEEIAADLVIVGIGLCPACPIAEEAGLEIAGGIVTDARGRTSAEGIWAAGDVAVFPYQGQPTRLESVQNAIDMGAALASDMLGQGQDYVPVPWFWSDQYDMKLQIAGLARDYDRIITRTDGDGVSHWYYAGDRFVAVDALNDPRAFMVGKRLVSMDKSPDPDAVADPATELKTLLRG
ncbi:NAD(P)/FAD-dependent oxidoreductase [Palleronia caenipelagi]|uniref:Pyridine nucleotide-disulfide oxidoreductase n=1 Tax=Palleronia caenipelagi TaxID=2489174 RepID=A0A547Q6M3_9RHOB|nr:FAD-dependent oxidoreductase [Palleronia caenipelagi]TRD21993.1 pyridine nucleotide-disulfide oxidoreductase [Palleronia caenipelagi]